MEKVTAPMIYSPLRKKFVSDIATYAEVCFAVVRVPGLDDVTEGKNEHLYIKSDLFLFLIFFLQFGPGGRMPSICWVTIHLNSVFYPQVKLNL